MEIAIVPGPIPSAKLVKLVSQPPPSPRLMSIPLSPMHVADAVPTAPSDAAANPTANPDATAPRSGPLCKFVLRDSPAL